MPEIRFAPAALDDLDEIRSWIGRENPEAADTMVDALVDRTRSRQDFPLIGEARPWLGKGVRRVVERPYLIFYRLGENVVLVLRVLHGARRITRRLLREG